MNKEERIRTFIAFCRGVFRTDICNEYKIEILKQEMKEIEEMKE